MNFSPDERYENRRPEIRLRNAPERQLVHRLKNRWRKTHTWKIPLWSKLVLLPYLQQLPDFGLPCFQLGNIGERIFEKISTGLCESKALIMIISKDYLKSVCCTDEWGAFYGKALHDKSCVIYPIIIDDSVPPALISQIKYLRFNDDEYTSALSTLLRSLRKQFSKWTSYLEDLSMLSLVYIPHYTLDLGGIIGYNSA